MAHWTDDATGAAILAGAFVALLGAAELWARAGAGRPESTRKFVHLGGGLICLLFPVLLGSPWIVLGMAAGMSGFFLAGARGGWLRSLHRVARPTRGSEYYPLAIFVAFLLAGDRPWLFWSSVLVLAAADTAAALIGARFGRARYTVEEESKSLEGSLAFFAVAFAGAWLPVALASAIPPLEGALACALTAALVTGFEAVSLRGTDNLFVPVAVCIALDRLSRKPLAEIEWQLGGFAAIAALLGLAAWRSRSFNVGGAIVAILATYCAWSLGSLHWAMPLGVGLAAYLLPHIVRPCRAREFPPIRVRTIFRAVLPAMAALALANGWNRYDFWYGPFLAACTAALGFGIWGRTLRMGVPRTPLRPARAAAVGFGAWFACAPLPWAMQAEVGIAPLAVLGLLGALSVPANDFFIGRPERLEGDRVWTLSPFVLAVLSGASIAALQASGLLETWKPL